jgi:protein ImuB
LAVLWFVISHSSLDIRHFPVFAVLHIADFALHAVLRNEPDVAHRPAALFTGTGKKSLVLAANPAARAAGVELGMTAPQAVARCPALVIRTPQPAAETEARAALVAVGFTLSPSIEDTAPGVCTIDLKGRDLVGSRTRKSLASAQTMKGNEPKSDDFGYIAQAAIGQLAQLGLPATAGLARTPLLALYAARAASSHLSRSPSEKTLTTPSAERTIKRTRTTTETNDCAADSVHIVTDEKNFLAPLPLAVADPPAELAAILADWGLRTLGDLTALPRDEIVRRFGAAGLALWQRAAGGSTRPLHPVAPPQTFAAAMEFEDEIETLEPLLFILRRFLDRLTLELLAAQLVAAELDLTLRLADDTRHARSFRLPEPTADAEILFRALHTHLESLQTASSISAIHLRLAPTRPLVRQQGLFETGLRDPHGFAETLARIVALVGSDRAGTPHLEDTHRPDAVKLTPPAAVIPPPASSPLHQRFGLPLRRFRPPLPARLEFTGSQPTYLWTENFHGALAATRGPWPSSGDWWQAGRAWRRTEWDIALVPGGLYRLLRVGDAWFIEGEYD